MCYTTFATASFRGPRTDATATTWLHRGLRMTRTALITGITGQDGSYLAELLLSKGYRVCGMIRRCSSENLQRIEHLRDRVELLQADLLDQTSIATVLEQSQPDEIYNLAAQSF